MKRHLTSDEIASLRVVLHDGGTHLAGESLGRCQNGDDFVFDPFSAYAAGIVSNPNVLVTGAIGTGKSTVVKMMVLRGLREGRRAVIMDPKGEYSDLARDLGGVTVALGARGTPWCNPFSGEFREDLTLVESLLSAARGRPLGDDERFCLETTWRRVEAGETNRPLRALFEGVAPHLHDAHRSAEREIAYTVRRFVHGDLAGLFDGDAEPVLPNGSLIVLDLSASWASDSFALTGLAAMATARRILDHEARAGYLVIDEAWAVLVDPRVAHWLHGSWKLARAKATSHILVLHRWSDVFAAADEGTAQRTKTTGILRDCDTMFFLRQDPSELALLNEVARLHAREAAYVVALPRGVALARYGTHRSVVRIRPNDRDARVIDTDQAMREPA